jgi:tetratricopeptide (TPR) repeat protein
VAVYAYTALGHWQKALEDGKEALKVAEKFSDDSLIAFAAVHICLAYTMKGDLYQAIKYGEFAVQKAPTQADKLWAENFLAQAQCRAGELQQGLEAGNKSLLINRAGRMRWGEAGTLLILGEGYFLAGDDEKATQTLKECLELAKRSDFKLNVGSTHSLLGQVAMKTDPIQAAYHFERSIAIFQKTKEDPALIKFMRSLVMLTRGNFRQGVKFAEDISPVFFENGSMWHHVTTEYMLGNLYLQIVIGEGSKTFTFLAKNIAFLRKSFPHASEKAEYHLNKTIEIAKDIGAKLLLGQAYYDMGLLHKTKKRAEQAKDCISEAIGIFKQCKAEEYLKQANEALESLL